MRTGLVGLTAALSILGTAACASDDRPPAAAGSSSATTTASTTPSPVTTSRAPQATFVMPDLRGQFWTDAEPLMRAVGWVGAVMRLPNARDTGYLANTVVEQVPPDGQCVPTDVAIQLQFAAA